MLQVSDTEQTNKSFGEKWSREAMQLGLKGPKAVYEIIKEQFLAILGLENIEEASDVFKDGMNCLNAGGGTAAWDILFNINKNVNRFVIDISSSVVPAYRDTKEIDNIFVAQADLFDLPFDEGIFDIIMSMGVLHHTGDAKRGFQSLCRHLKSGGLIGIYVYCTKPFLREMADSAIRKITTEMKFDECLKFSRQMADLGKELQEVRGIVNIKEGIPVLGIKKGEYCVQEFIYNYFLKCYFNDRLEFETSALCNADWYHPKHASHHTYDEVMSWFDGYVDVKCIQPAGWEHSGYFVSGRKNG